MRRKYRTNKIKLNAPDFSISSIRNLRLQRMRLLSNDFPKKSLLKIAFVFLKKTVIPILGFAISCVTLYMVIQQTGYMSNQTNIIEKQSDLMEKQNEDLHQQTIDNSEQTKIASNQEKIAERQAEILTNQYITSLPNVLIKLKNDNRTFSAIIPVQNQLDLVREVRADLPYRIIIPYSLSNLSSNPITITGISLSIPQMGKVINAHHTGSLFYKYDEDEKTGVNGEELSDLFVLKPFETKEGYSVFPMNNTIDALNIDADLIVYTDRKEFKNNVSIKKMSGTSKETNVMLMENMLYYMKYIDKLVGSDESKDVIKEIEEFLMERQSDSEMKIESTSKSKVGSNLNLKIPPAPANPLYLINTGNK